MEKKPETRAVLDSTEAMFAEKLKQDIEAGKVDILLLVDDQAVKELLASKFKRHPKIGEASLDGIIAELKKNGVIKEPEIVAPPKKEKVVPEHVALPKLKGLEIVEDEEIKEIFRTNEERERELALMKVEQDAVFDNEEELNDLYKGVLKLEKNRAEETDAYYYEFLNLGEKYSPEQIAADIKSVRDREEEFEQKYQASGHYKEIKKTEKIAAMAEIGVAYGFSEAGWAGDKVKVRATSKFDDIKRRTDELMEIEESGERHILGLGIDLTFQSLGGKDYKRKVFTLLESVKDGFKTKVKYAKNYKGEPMPEFVVPKVIIKMDIDEVKKLAYLMKNIDDPKMKDRFKNSTQKVETLNQIIVSCEVLGAFAEEYKNPVSRNYKKALTSLERLAQSDPDIKAIFDSKHGSKILTRFKQLIKEFKELQQTGVNWKEVIENE